MTNENKVVLFADILGFASLTETYPIDVEHLKMRDRILAPSRDLDALREASKNKLTHAFSGFHSALGFALNVANWRHPLTAITFSDSAFIATTHIYEAINVAIDLQHSLLSQKIPVRMGIGYGSFAALRFRSDITADSGDHAAQFLGTAVVRAYAAETCGIKGLRILLHPSVMPLLDDIATRSIPATRNLHPLHFIECSETERRDNKAGVFYEIDYWHLKPTKEADAWRSLQDMWDSAPSGEEGHYQATAEAINRMRIAQGRKSMKTPRRRTLN